MIVQNLNDFLRLKLKNVNDRCYIVGVDKKDAIDLLNNFVLNNKGIL